MDKVFLVYRKDLFDGSINVYSAYSNEEEALKEANYFNSDGEDKYIHFVNAVDLYNVFEV